MELFKGSVAGGGGGEHKDEKVDIVEDLPAQKST
jgi:hypothetical protein